MKCPTCVNEGLRSKVYLQGGTVTCMGWISHYDEDGLHHSHDPNWHSQNYTCSQGHNWISSYLANCPSCDYGGKREVG